MKLIFAAMGFNLLVLLFSDRLTGWVIDECPSARDFALSDPFTAFALIGFVVVFWSPFVAWAVLVRDRSARP